MASFGKLFALVPIAHLTACYLYLYCFIVGFKSNIQDLTAISDIFNVGFGKLFPIYIQTAVLVPIVLMASDRSPTALLIGREPEMHPSLESRPLKLFFFGLLFVAIPIMQIILLVYRNEVDLISLSASVAGAVTFFGSYQMAKAGINKWHTLGASLCLYTLVALPAKAYRDGFHARFEDYDQMHLRASYCRRDYKLLFSIGEFRVINRPDGRRIGINKDCKEVIYFEGRRPTIQVI